MLYLSHWPIFGVLVKHWNSWNQLKQLLLKTPKKLFQICSNEPDFVVVESWLEIVAHNHGFKVLFLSKFYCELNFIEQCWGYEQVHYHVKAPSSWEDDLEKNVLEALNKVQITTMWRKVHKSWSWIHFNKSDRFATHSLHFMDTYQKKLNGR